MGTPPFPGTHDNMEIESTPSKAETMASPEKKKEPDLRPAESVEIQPADAPEKTYFSKASVWLMILFSGLAIGSDG